MMELFQMMMSYSSQGRLERVDDFEIGGEIERPVGDKRMDDRKIRRVEHWEGEQVILASVEADDRSARRQFVVVEGKIVDLAGFNSRKVAAAWCWWVREEDAVRVTGASGNQEEIRSEVCY